MTTEIVLAGGTRTAMGGFGGALADVPAPALGAAAIREAIVRGGVPADAVDEVIFGNVISAGLGQNPARQATLGAGLGTGIGATTINKVCGSGLKAVMLAAQAIQAGDAGVVIAGGMESMSRAPYLLDKARAGYRMGDGALIDSMIRDGLCNAYDHLPMGVFGDRLAAKYGFSRQAQDDFAAESYRRAQKAQADGSFAREIVAVKTRAGMVAEDEQPKRFDEAKMRQLRPVFSQDGTITAGNASGISDGAAAVIVLSARRAGELGVKAAARILGYASAAREPEWFGIAPVDAIRKLLAKLSMKAQDIGLFEINEAFAVVAMAAMKDLNIPHDKLNVHGGAVALGHPIGASGARTLVTLLNAMKQRGAKIGIDAICIGGGEAVAVAVELV